MSLCCSQVEVFFTEQQSNEVAAWCGPLLQDGDSRKSGMQIFHRRDWDKDAGNRIGAEAVEKAAELLSATPIKGGKLPVVLDEHVAPRFFRNVLRSIFGRIRTARNVTSAWENSAKKLPLRN